MINYNETKITSIQDYICWIKNAHDFEVPCDNGTKKNHHDKIYFRGQAKNEWPLISGVFRDDSSNYMSEHNLLQHAMWRLSLDLSALPSYLEKLIFLQHYGLKTRLLDVTFNPLIALYFACSSHAEDDGAVYCGCRQLLVAWYFVF